MIQIILLFVYSVYSQSYEEWINKYNKKYDPKREIIYYSNLDWVNSYNSQFDEPKLTIDNEFADLDPLEFKDKYINANKPEIQKSKIIKQTQKTNVKHNNKPIDWIRYMQPIQNQGYCGSCYAFAMTAAMEGYLNIHYNNSVKLSEQYIVDCIGYYDYSDYEDGCQGARISDIIEFGEDIGVLADHEYHLYDITQTKSKKCREPFIDDYNTERYHVNEYEVFQGESGYETGLQSGPLYIMIRADPYLQQFSAPNTIIDDPDCNNGDVDHGVVLVGWDYDEKTDQEFWIIRNSWGASWGNAGYGYIAKGKNMCKIEDLKENMGILVKASGYKLMISVICLLLLLMM